MARRDLVALGTEALYAAARSFDDSVHPEFTAFARYHVRAAMLAALDDLLFEERIKRAALTAEDNHGAARGRDDYNVMKHDESEARRRFRTFANGVAAATFAAGMEEARAGVEEAELAERDEYARAIRVLDSAVAWLSESDRALLALLHRDRMTLKAASEALGIPYGTARARHVRALTLFHDLLRQQGITRAPRPNVAPSADVLGASPAHNDVEDGTEPKVQGDEDPS